MKNPFLLLITLCIVGLIQSCKNDCTEYDLKLSAQHAKLEKITRHDSLLLVRNEKLYDLHNAIGRSTNQYGARIDSINAIQTKRQLSKDELIDLQRSIAAHRTLLIIEDYMDDIFTVDITK